MDDRTKTCKVCCFVGDKSKFRGKLCLLCVKTYKQRWYQNNKVDILENRKEYYEQNKEDRIAYAKEWKSHNLEKVIKSNKKYRNNNKEKAKEYLNNNRHRIYNVRRARRKERL